MRIKLDENLPAEPIASLRSLDTTSKASMPK